MLSSEIIPERRRKYLSNNGANDDPPPYAKAVDDNAIIQAQETFESKAVKKNRKNVHLQPIEHQSHKRNTSVPPSGNGPAAPHPLNFAPSPHG